MVYFITNNVEQKHPLIAPPCRDVIIDALRWARDNGRMWLLSYVIMDDHFHFMMMLREGFVLSKVMMNLKRHTSREINKVVDSADKFWQEGYHDRAIRGESDFWGHFHYMRNNPVRRGWVEKAEDYLWSTAHPSREGDIDWHAIGF